MLSAVRGAGLLARLPGTMASMADTMRQLRALSSTVGRLREETRRFLETKDRELGEVESSIQAIQTSLTAAAAAPLPAAGGTKRPLDGRPEAANKRVREEVKLGDELRKEEKSAVKEEGASFMVRGWGGHEGAMTPFYTMTKEEAGVGFMVRVLHTGCSRIPVTPS